MKSKSTAAVLALIGGIFGLHKFYLGKQGAGVLYALLTVFSSTSFAYPISTILGVIDAIVLFTMSEEKFNAKYNKHTQQNPLRQRRQGSSRSDTKKDIRRERKRYQYNEKIANKQRDNPFRRSADQKYKEYDFEGALQDYAKASEITPADNEMHFNMANIYSMMENTDKSLFHLEQAIEMGFMDKERIKSADGLAYLRIQPEYDAFIDNGYKITKGGKQIAPPKGDLLQDDVLLAQLKKLKELRSKGMLSEKEFTYEKEKLLRR